MHRLYPFLCNAGINSAGSDSKGQGRGRKKKRGEREKKKEEKIVGRNIPPAGFSKLLFTVRRNGVHGGKNNSGRPG